ncbi:hypothetical protein ACYJ1Y_00810 [Natrialbaceae archaeon A-gly3]
MTVERFQNGKRVIDRWNQVFEALTAEPRRQLIVSLLDAPDDESVSLPEAAASPTVPPEPDPLRIQLRHRHLPMLEDAGFVRWDEEPFQASRGPRFEEAAVVFETLHDNAAAIPDQLVRGCRRLEDERHE